MQDTCTQVKSLVAQLTLRVLIFKKNQGSNPSSSKLSNYEQQQNIHALRVACKFYVGYVISSTIPYGLVDP